MERKRSCKDLKKSGLFFRPPDVDAGEILISAAVAFVPVPFIARALKVVAVGVTKTIIKYAGMFRFKVETTHV